MSERITYCLDIFIENGQKLRDELVIFLKNIKGGAIAFTELQFGEWTVMKSIRIRTLQAEELRDYIIQNLSGSENYSYDVFFSKEKAENSWFWDPDNNKPFTV